MSDPKETENSKELENLETIIERYGKVHRIKK